MLIVYQSALSSLESRKSQPENLFFRMSSKGGVGWKRPLLAKSELSVVWSFRRLVVVGEQASLASSSEFADRVWCQPTPSNRVIPGGGELPHSFHPKS